MVDWCNLSYLKIKSDIEPCVGIRTILPTDDTQLAKYKKSKPFINKKRIMWDIKYCNRQYCFVIERNYYWDGATIIKPLWWLIGSKESNEFLIPSMVHDILCENHRYIDDDRKLSTLIFKQLLLKCKVNKIKANIMCFFVDLWQRTQGWDR